MIELLYHERPPFYVTQENGEIGGLVGEPAGRILARSGLAHSWVVMAANTQLWKVEEATGAVCAVGWFRTSAREAFGKFSDPIYRDRPQLVLARSGDRRVLRHSAVSGLLADNGLRMGVKLGYSYGRELDGMIEKSAPVRVTTSQDMPGMLRMLLGDRFDYFLVSSEEADGIIESVREASDRVTVHAIPDMPEGSSRHFLCGRNTPDEVIDRLNTAIKTLSGPQKAEAK